MEINTEMFFFFKDKVDKTSSWVDLMSSGWFCYFKVSGLFVFFCGVMQWGNELMIIQLWKLESLKPLDKLASFSIHFAC